MVVAAVKHARVALRYARVNKSPILIQNKTKKQVGFCLTCRQEHPQPRDHDAVVEDVPVRMGHLDAVAHMEGELEQGTHEEVPSGQQPLS